MLKLLIIREALLAFIDKEKTLNKMLKTGEINDFFFTSPKIDVNDKIYIAEQELQNVNRKIKEISPNFKFEKNKPMSVYSIYSLLNEDL